MSVKAKGINAERELVHMFWGNNWSSIRVAGSGSSRFPSPDLLASNAERTLAIEVKVTKGTYKHFLAKEIDELKTFSQIFGAEPWIAIKFKRSEWIFLNVHDLQSTGENYSISVGNAKEKGIGFNELIDNI